MTTDPRYLWRRAVRALPRALATALALILAGCAGATSAPPPPRAEPAAATPPEPEPAIPDLEATRLLADQACPTVSGPYFYRVAKAGKVSHMLGTRHVGVSLDKMPARVRDTLLAAKLVVFETAPDEPDPPDRAYTGSLAEELGPDLWRRYRALVGDDLADAVDRAGPAVALLALAVLYEHKLALLDVEIEQLVRGANIPTAGLESSAFQDRLLGELLDMRMLRATIAGTPSRAELRRSSIADLTEYCAGTDEQPGMDADDRAQLRKGGYTDAELEALDRKLLDDRNAAWLPKLDKLFAHGGVMVVVGSDHLIGERGLAKQLARRGYQVERVRP